MELAKCNIFQVITKCRPNINENKKGILDSQTQHLLMNAVIDNHQES